MHDMYLYIMISTYYANTVYKDTMMTTEDWINLHVYIIRFSIYINSRNAFQDLKYSDVLKKFKYDFIYVRQHTLKESKVR